MKQNEALSKPFFAQFLEMQEKQHPNTEGIITWPWPPGTTAPGRDKETMKYPSDDDEDIFI